METWKWIQRVAAVLVIAMAILGMLMLVSGQEVAQGGDYGSACYRTDGGNTWICGPGGEMRIDAGGTLNVAGSADFSVITATELTGDVTGDLTGNVTGTVTGNLTGNVTGDILGSNGTTIHDNVIVTGTLDAAGEINYGSNDLYPIGAVSDGAQAAWGSTTITGTLNVVHGLSTLGAGFCTLGQAPSANGAYCAVVISGSTMTINVYKGDYDLATVGTKIHWYAIGLP